MLLQPSQQLVNDHDALDRVLKHLKSALDREDVEICHTILDLFWARLAVHIRAEHLHLFPVVLNGLTETKDKHRSLPSLTDAHAVIERLRADHHYFMHRLADAIESMRKRRAVSEKGILTKTVSNLRNTIIQIERRLADHNELEENQIYRWVVTILKPQEQVALARAISGQLAKRPPRFSREAWSND